MTLMQEQAMDLIKRMPIESELVQARECYEKGEGEFFDDAVDEISAKYGL